LGVGKARFEGLVIRVDIETLSVGNDGIEVLVEAEMGGAMTAVALGLSGLSWTIFFASERASK